MKSTILLQAALVLVLSAGSAFTQEARNAARKVEISYTGNIPLFSYVARTFRVSHFVRKEGPNLLGACVQVAVRVMDSGALVGEFCGTHQFLAGEQVDSLHSVRGGMRLSKFAGSRTTTFVQGLGASNRAIADMPIGICSACSSSATAGHSTSRCPKCAS